MCWKKINKLLNFKPSITLRLTLLYSFTTFVLLLFVTCFLNFALVHFFYSGSYQLLTDEISTLKNLLNSPTLNKLALKKELEGPPYQFGEPIYFYHIRILDDKGQTIIATPTMEPLLTQTSFFKNLPSKANEETTEEWTSPGGKPYLMMQLKTAGQPTYTIQVALEVSSQLKEIEQYRNQLILALFLGTFLAVILGYLVARSGMKALKDLTDETEKITVSALNRRIDPNSWPTELKKLGIAFNNMLERIELSFTHLKEFSADLAHELRTPVNNLMLETEVMLEADCTTEDYKQVLASNLEELQQISRIFENILFLTQIENNSAAIKLEKLNVANEIAVICDYHQAMADEKNIQIQYSGQAEIHFNQIMFRRLMSNLLSNAIKYSNENSVIDFSIKKLPNQLVEVLLTDNGIGIALEHLDKIFNRFYRVDASRAHSGIGLGLAIAKSIMELHQGQIVISSELGRGTIIQLLFK